MFEVFWHTFTMFMTILLRVSDKLLLGFDFVLLLFLTHFGQFSFVWPTTAGTYPGFFSMKWLILD